MTSRMDADVMKSVVAHMLHTTKSGTISALLEAELPSDAKKCGLTTYGSNEQYSGCLMASVGEGQNDELVQNVLLSLI